MRVDTLTTADDALLSGIRETLEGAESALLCVAFVSMEGVQLLRPQLERLGDKTRLLVTTRFGFTKPEALNQASDFGVRVASLNPGGAQTYHPKLYLGLRGDEMWAVVGSSNLTSGLVGNVEVAIWLRGDACQQALREAWEWGEKLWRREQVRPWEKRDLDASQQTGFESDLYELLRARFEAKGVRDRVVRTLGAKPRPNRVTDLTRTGLHVETERTLEYETGPQPIPAWMFNVAWTYLRAHGHLANKHLLDVLHVHRSSAVCAILAQLEEVRVASRRPIRLEWVGK